MRRFGVVTAILLSLALASTVMAAGGPGKLFALPVIGIQTVALDEGHLEASEGDGRSVIAAFIETGSLDSRCLATLSEANIAGIVKELYCAPRQVAAEGRLMNGLFLHIFLDTEAPEDMHLVVNYYQERMVTNPAPIPCRTTESGC